MLIKGRKRKLNVNAETECVDARGEERSSRLLINRSSLLMYSSDSSLFSLWESGFQVRHLLTPTWCLDPISDPCLLFPLIENKQLVCCPESICCAL